MTSREMHYDFKQKLNKIDSQQNRNLNVPEIDWKLNEAQEMFIIMTLEELEEDSSAIDKLRTITVSQSKLANTHTIVTVEEDSFIAPVPSDYWRKLKLRAYNVKATCKKYITCKPIEYDDEENLSPFDRSSFIWNVCNYKETLQGFRLFPEKDTIIEHVCIDYIRKPKYIHNAQDYVGGQYQTLSGVTLTSFFNCELPELYHKRIVDLAVLVTTGDLSLQDYQFKMNKLKLIKL